MASAGARVVLAAHDIRYDLSLSEAHGDTIAASGGMHYRVEDRCDAWGTQQRLMLRTVARSGVVTEMVSDYATLERKDGRDFLFETRQSVDGRLTSRIAGEARREADGVVSVYYSRPEVRRVVLPKGVLFPLAHTAAIVSAAEGGRRDLAPDLFDGTSAEGALRTYVTIQGWSGLGTGASGRVHVAFFEPKGGMTPDFSLGARYFADGVSDRLAMDFGDFTLAGDEVSFRRLPGCGR